MTSSDSTSLRAAPAEVQVEARDPGVEEAAVLAPVADDRAVAALPRMQERPRLSHVSRWKIAPRHAQELVPRVAVRVERSLVDGEKVRRLDVMDPHRERAALEEIAIAPFRFARFLLGTRPLDRISEHSQQELRIRVAFDHVVLSARLDGLARQPGIVVAGQHDDRQRWHVAAERQQCLEPNRVRQPEIE